MFYITENSFSGLINRRVYPLEVDVDIIAHTKKSPRVVGWMAREVPLCWEPPSQFHFFPVGCT